MSYFMLNIILQSTKKKQQQHNIALWNLMDQSQISPSHTITVTPQILYNFPCGKKPTISSDMVLQMELV